MYTLRTGNCPSLMKHMTASSHRDLSSGPSFSWHFLGGDTYHISNVYNGSFQNYAHKRTSPSIHSFKISMEDVVFGVGYIHWTQKGSGVMYTVHRMGLGLCTLNTEWVWGYVHCTENGSGATYTEHRMGLGLCTLHREWVWGYVRIYGSGAKYQDWVWNYVSIHRGYVWQIKCCKHSLCYYPKASCRFHCLYALEVRIARDACKQLWWSQMA